MKRLPFWIASFMCGILSSIGVRNEMPEVYVPAILTVIAVVIMDIMGEDK